MVLDRLARVVVDVCSVIAPLLSWMLLAPACFHPDLGLSPGAPQQDDPASGCFDRWMTGELEFSEPAELTSLSGAGFQRDPWISRDGSRLYYTQSSNMAKNEVFQATRSQRRDPFHAPQPIAGVNTYDNDGSPSSTADETTLVLSRDGDPVNPRYRVYISSRNNTDTPFGQPSDTHLAAVNNIDAHLHDPFLTDDGNRLYLAPDSDGRQRLAIASRRSADEDFGALKELPNLSEAMSNDAEPALSPDENIIVFRSMRTSDTFQGFNLFYATRADSRDTFNRPTPIPGVNSDADDAGPVLSADGCELFFARAPHGTDAYHLYSATMKR